jgi:glycosyltransferase involved in cell wall biosynthesis
MSVLKTALTLEDLPSPPPDKSGWPWTKQSQPLPERMPNGLEWPRISIVTPSYNQGCFLEATIRSVLLQGYPNLEYIIIDGGSSDETIEILNKYSKFLSYWISERDRGQTHAINKGLAKSSGEIIGWINSDDLYTSRALLTIASAFRKNPSVDLIHGNRILINALGKVTGWSILPKFAPSQYGYVICSETTFWNRSSMEKVGLLNESLECAMDLEFFLRIYKIGKFLKLDDFIGYFRYHDSSKSSTLKSQMHFEATAIWRNEFGEDEKIRIKPKGNIVRYFYTLIKNPFLVCIPYLKGKLQKLSSSN